MPPGLRLQMTRPGPSFIVILSFFVEGYLFTISAKLHVSISDKRILRFLIKYKRGTNHDATLWKPCFLLDPIRSSILVEGLQMTISAKYF